MKEFGFKTKKSAFENFSDMYKVKEFIFAYCTIDDIVDELGKNGIKVNTKELLEEYNKCFCLQNVLDIYNDKYFDKFDVIDDKQELFDGDAFAYLMNRLIVENYDVSTLPDPDFIANEFFKNKDIHDEDKPQRLLSLLIRLNKIKDHNSEKNLQSIFEPYALYIEDVLDECSSFPMRKDIVNKTISTKLARELINLTEYYELDDNKYMYSLAMDIAGIYGFNSIKNILEKAIARYPQSEIRFLVNAATSISEKDNNHKNLLNRIRAIQPKTDEDNNYLDILSEWFD